MGSLRRRGRDCIPRFEARALRARRKALKLSGKQVAVEMGWSQSKVSRIENGEISVSDADLQALVDLYDNTTPPDPRPPKQPVTRHLVSGIPTELWQAAMIRAHGNGESLAEVIRRGLQQYVEQSSTTVSGHDHPDEGSRLPEPS